MLKFILNKYFLISLFTLHLALLALLLPSPASAFTGWVNYQGRAFNIVGGQPQGFVGDGCYPVLFHVARFNTPITAGTTPVAGTGRVFDSTYAINTHPSQTCNPPTPIQISGWRSVYVENGLFNALLNVVDYENNMTNGAYYGIQVNFNNQGWSAWQPLASAATAQTSAKLAGSTGAAPGNPGANVLGDLNLSPNAVVTFTDLSSTTPLRIYSRGSNNGAGVSIWSNGLGGASDLYNDIENWGGTYYWRYGSASGMKDAMVLRNGNLGIGTTSPASKLEVAGNWEIARFSGGTAPYITIGNGLTSTTGGYIQYDDTNNTLNISPHGILAMNITSSGNVGIGTTPTQKLDIAGSLAIDGKAALDWNGSDNWLRLGQNPSDSAVTYDVHTPGVFGPKTINIGAHRGDWAFDPGLGNLEASGNIAASGWIGAGCEIACSSSGGYSIMYADGNTENSGSTVTTGNISSGSLSTGNISSSGDTTIAGTLDVGGSLTAANISYSGLIVNPANNSYYINTPSLTSLNELAVNRIYLDGKWSLGTNGPDDDWLRLYNWAGTAYSDFAANALYAANNVYAQGICLGISPCITSWPTFTEVDTLGSVTGRGHVTSNKIGLTDTGIGSDEGYNGRLVITRGTATGQYINLIRNGNQAWSIGTVYNYNTFGIGPGNVTDSSFDPSFRIDAAGNASISNTFYASKLVLGTTTLRNDPSLSGRLNTPNDFRAANLVSDGGVYIGNSADKFFGPGKGGDPSLVNKTASQWFRIGGSMGLHFWGRAGVDSNDAPDVEIKTDGNLYANNSLCLGGVCKNAWPGLLTGDYDRPGTAVPISTENNHADSEYNEVSCPNGYVMTGVRAAGGYYADKIKIICRRISQ